jgi:hypothetical protein
MDLEGDKGAKVKGGAEDVLPGSLLGLVGVFVAVIQARFDEPSMPWRWSPSFTREETQDGTSDNPDPIYVTSVYANEPQARNTFPRVVVSVPSAQLQQVVVGNRAAVRLPDRRQDFYAHDYLTIAVRCYGREPGEAATIADIVRSHVAVCANQIREVMKLHEIGLPALTEPQEAKDNEAEAPGYVAVVSFRVINEFKWSTKPIATLLQEISLAVSTGRVSVLELAMRGFTR